MATATYMATLRAFEAATEEDAHPYLGTKITSVLPYLCRQNSYPYKEHQDVIVSATGMICSFFFVSYYFIFFFLQLVGCEGLGSSDW